MKLQTVFHHTFAPLLAVGVFTLAPAQETVTTETATGDEKTITTETTSTAGTITEFSPEVIVVRSESASPPVRYSYTKTTRYVDENGNTVTVEQIKSGRPVTVHYTKVGDKLVAQRVVVRNGTKETTTTTIGTATTVTPEGIVVQRATDRKPLRYTYTKTTRYVDESGTPVAIEQITNGKPVTVHYVKDGDRFIAQRVIVHKVLPTPPPQVIEKKTTTTTTTEEPVKPRKDNDDDDDDDDD